MAESKEKLKSLLEKVKEEREKIALKLNIQIMRITASSPISSVQFSHSVVSNYLQCHGLQNARLPCPSPSPGVFENSCALSRWCHPTISSSVAPFSSCPQAFPASRAFSSESVLCIRWPKYWSFSFSFSPSNEYSGLISCRIDWLDLLAVQGSLKSLFQHRGSKASFFGTQPFLLSNSHIQTWLLEKP